MQYGKALLAKRIGKTKMIAENSCGQHGVATATVCALMGSDRIVFMVEIDIARQDTKCCTNENVRSRGYSSNLGK